MKLFSANIEDLRTLYVENLRKALDMEQHTVKALPKMIDKSSDSELSEALSSHLDETRGHVNRVTALLDELTGEASTAPCKVISSLITEAEDTIKDVTDPNVLDVAIIASAQQVEHHEIAIYGTLRSWAELLALDSHAKALDTILQQEKNADATLTALSDDINVTADAVAPARA